MRHTQISRAVLITLLAGVVWGCGQRGMSPLSPSELSSRSTGDAPRSGGTSLAPRRADNDGDGYDDADPGPEPGPAPDPNVDPNAPPPVDGVPVPVQLTISIVGTFGPAAFAPNPQQAAIGNMIVWTNNDLIQHIIVLDDGTPVGTLAPGHSSLPIALMTETAGYHCTLHPSMAGQIVPIPVGEPIPPDGSAPPPGQPPPDNGDGGGDDDGYDDDYY